MDKLNKQLLALIVLSYFFGSGMNSSFAGADEELLKSLGFDFVVDSNATVSKKNTRGHYVLGMGLAVDESCFKLYPKKEIPAVFQKMLVKGLSCMKRAEVGSNVTRDLESFRKLLSNKSNLPKIECDKNIPDTAYAIGSSPGPSRNHPYIWLARMGNKEFIESAEFFQGVVFHELLHNIRYFHHPDDLEVTSGCEECCFGKMTGDKKAAACRVCGSAYETLDDPEYIKSLLVWDGKFYGRIIAEETFVKAFKDPSLLKSLHFKNALNAFLKEIKNPVKPEVGLLMADQIMAGEMEKVESVLKTLPDNENSHRARFFLYRLMSFSFQEKGDITQMKVYQAKAESFRKKYI